MYTLIALLSCDRCVSSLETDAADEHTATDLDGVLF